MNNDIVCSTETWGSDLFDFHVDGFEYFLQHRTHKIRGTTRNSGGLALYIPSSLLCNNNINDCIVSVTDDSHIWFKLDRNMFGFDQDLYVCLCYIVPSNSSRNIFINSNIYDTLLEDIANINKM